METETVEKKTKTVEKKTIVSQLESIEKVLNELIVSHKKAFNSTEAALYLKHSRGHLYRLIWNEDLPFYRPKGKKYYFKRQELDYWRLTRVHPIKAKAKGKKIIFGFSQNG